MACLSLHDTIWFLRALMLLRPSALQLMRAFEPSADNEHTATHFQMLLDFSRDTPGEHLQVC